MDRHEALKNVAFPVAMKAVFFIQKAVKPGPVKGIILNDFFITINQHK